MISTNSHTFRLEVREALGGKSFWTWRLLELMVNLEQATMMTSSQLEYFIPKEIVCCVNDAYDVISHRLILVFQLTPSFLSYKMVCGGLELHLRCKEHSRVTIHGVSYLILLFPLPL